MNEEKMDYNSVTKNRKVKKFIVIGLVLLAIILLIVFVISEYQDNSSQQLTVDDELSISAKLELDYEQGKITTDEYVKYNLYAEYNSELLNEEYTLFTGKEVSVHADELIEKYYDELSDETLKYYVDKINLDNITFELNKENYTVTDKIALSNLFVDTVYANEEDVTNLNKAILSDNGNFIVWYTTTGDSATDYEAAKKIADGLEKTIETYDKLFKSNYRFSSEILSKGKTYQNQIEILRNSNIDSDYLESAMQVYLVNYTNDSLAKYVRGYTKLSELWNKIKGGDEYGSIIFPYILIKPSSFSDFERLEQLYNHELFHHYQYDILCGSFNCNMGSDPYIVEATANWASALATTKKTNNGFLNEWAGTARKYSSNLMSSNWANKYGLDNVGYALFVYLNNYSANVPKGIQNIKQSIYQNDALQFLEDNTQTYERERTQQAIALENLRQGYKNKNLIVDENYEHGITIQKVITDTTKLKNIELNRIGIDYYKIELNKNTNYNIKLIGNKDSGGNLYAYLIAKKDGIYRIVNYVQYDDSDKSLKIASDNEYEELYLGIANISLTNNYKYSFEVEKQKNPKKGQYFIKCNDNYMYYFDMDDDFVMDTKSGSIGAREFSNNQNIETGTRISVYMYCQDNIDSYFEIFHDSFEQSAFKGDYKNIVWSKNNNLKINDNIIQYDYVKYKINGKSGIIYNDGKNNYDVILKENKIQISALIKLEKGLYMDLSIYMSSKKDFSQMEKVEDVLTKIARTNFVIEEIK